MPPLALRRAALTAFATATTCLTLAGFTVPASAAAVTSAQPGGTIPFTVSPPVGVAAAASALPDSVPASLTTPGSAGSPPRQLLVPDLIAAVPAGITSAQLTKIGKLAGVRAVLPINGGKVTVNGVSADVLGVSPQAFRSWTPPATAAANAVWTDLGRGQLVSTRAAASELHLTTGNSYQVSAAVQVQLPFGAQTALSVPGVDVIVDQARSAQLGLAKNFAALINAPGVNLVTLMSQVRSVIGVSGKVINLVPVVTVSKLPVATNVPTGGVPKSLLTLYKESAEEYCPGMSWTVLAAINEIESGDGANEGPSSAGALGPMQFIPSTWAEWGIDGFGQTGTPDIMNPLDAVPSAARLLCAAGAGNTKSLYGAIFAYNHASWYVDEVLALASEYAQNYP
ncbi:MAG: lytic transglycosylase domain-containing protein [Actinomycetota bacterium]|nr:lytic transglycosylase domain-containing protein [Actinomycetota bacterium]